MKILKAIWNLLEGFASARAAGILARQGRKQEAIALMDQSGINKLQK